MKFQRIEPGKIPGPDLGSRPETGAGAVAEGPGTPEADIEDGPAPLFAAVRVTRIKDRRALTAMTTHGARRDKTCRENPREGYDPEKRAWAWAWTAGPKPPAGPEWIGETPAKNQKGERNAVPQPVDYTAAQAWAVERQGATERKNAPLGLHIGVLVSPEWIAERGGLHDRTGPAWDERIEPLVRESTRWIRSMFGVDAVSAMRYDQDEEGAGWVDFLIVPVTDAGAGKGAPKPTVSSNKKLEEIAKAAGKDTRQQALAVLQDSWADWARNRLDPRFERGAPKTETGRENLAPAAYRRVMRILDKEKKQAIRERDEAIRLRDAAIADWRRVRASAQRISEWAGQWVRWAREFQAYLPAEFVARMPSIKIPDETMLADLLPEPEPGQQTRREDDEPGNATANETGPEIAP